LSMVRLEEKQQPPKPTQPQKPIEKPGRREFQQPQKPSPTPKPTQQPPKK